jgi:DNA-binding transcriptional MerR regulator
MTFDSSGRFPNADRKARMTYLAAIRTFLMHKNARHKSNGTYSLAEVAKEVGVSPEKISDWSDAETGKRRSSRRKAGGSRRFSSEDVRRFERCRLLEDIRVIFADPDVWLDTPNPRTAGETPREAIDGGNEQLVIDIVEAIKHGMIS